MNEIGKVIDFSLRYVFEPGLNWVLDHPIISLLLVVGLVYWSARGYRML
jgi:hypothetical protein